jgi:serine protease inhibitor
MVVSVLNDFASFEAALTTELLLAVVGSVSDGGVHPSLARWTARSHITVNDTLAELGMRTAFTRSTDFWAWSTAAV